MEYQDRVLKCAECSAEFVFTAGEQMFFADKGFKNEPKRCKSCKASRAAGNGNGSGNGVQRVETKTVCSQCGKETTVPFKPTQGRPVLCRSCFQMKRVPSGVAAAANLDSPAAQVAAAAAALDGAMNPETVMAPAAGSAAATMEMIAETPGMMMAESDAAGELVASSPKAS